MSIDVSEITPARIEALVSDALNCLLAESVDISAFQDAISYQGFDAQYVRKVCAKLLSSIDLIKIIICDMERGPTSCAAISADKARMTDDGFKIWYDIVKKLDLKPKAAKSRRTITSSRITKAFPEVAIKVAKYRKNAPVALLTEDWKIVSSGALASLAPSQGRYTGSDGSAHNWTQDQITHLLNAQNVYNYLVSMKVSKEFIKKSVEERKTMVETFTRAANGFSEITDQNKYTILTSMNVINSLGVVSPGFVGIGATWAATE